MMRFILFVSVLLMCRWSETDGQPGKEMIDLSAGPDTLEIFAPGIISTGLYERDLAIAPDGAEIIYTLGDYRQLNRCLVSLRRNGDRWDAPQILPFSGLHQDIEPFISPDGMSLYFASKRPLPGAPERKDYNIWVSQKLNGTWSDPVPLDTIVNSPADEYYPSVTRNGDMYFTTTREGGIGSEDIYVSRFVDGVYHKPEVLDTHINSETYEFNAYISPDGDLLIFSSYGRPDDHGGGDLYFSRRNSDGRWSKATNAGSLINSPRLDFCPFVDAGHGVLYFTSERTAEHGRISTVGEFLERTQQPGNGLGDLYRISLDRLGEK